MLVFKEVKINGPNLEIFKGEQKLNLTEKSIKSNPIGMFGSFKKGLRLIINSNIPNRICFDWLYVLIW